jgi:tetratricopeptide (TPR) repeat protein
MRRFVCVVIGLAFCLAEARAAAPSRWTRLRTPNFILLGENGDRPLRRVGERLEQFREVFARVFPSTRQTLPSPAIVYVFGSERAYQPFMPLFNGKRVDVGGYFQGTAGAYYITLDTEAGDRAYPVIFHEYVHLLVGNAQADVPVWFSEGLAEYYSTYQLWGEREATLGRVHEGHVLNLRERFIPLSELLAVDHTSPLYNEGDRRSIFYAESWALVHYLLIGNPRREGQLAKYLQLYADGVPNDRAIAQAFGVTALQLEKELRQYVQQSAYHSTRVRFTDKVAIDRDWQVDQPADADGQAALADLLLAMRRYDEAAARVEAVLATTPGHARAQAILGRVRAAQGKPAEAMTLLDAAVKAAGDDYLPSYYQALVLLRGEGQTSAEITGDVARRGRALLQDATRLQPGLADAHGLSAWASLAAGDPKAALDSAAKAFALSPRHEYALFHARARVYLREPGVRPALVALMERGSAEWIRNEARELLVFLAQLQEAAPRIAGSRTPAPAATGAAPATGDTPAMPPGPSRRGAIVPIFRKMGPGELREIGIFEGADCARDGVTFRIKTPSRVLRANAKAFDQVEFFTYRAEPPGQVGCGARPSRERVYVTYRADGGPPGSDGVLVAIELLPDDFQP